MTIESFLFYFLGTISVGSALMMVTRRNPVIAALYLILNFFALGGHSLVSGGLYALAE